MRKTLGKGEGTLTFSAMEQLLHDLHDLVGCAVRLYDDRRRGLMGFGGAQPICMTTHSSEFKAKGAALSEHCYAFDAKCLQDAERTGDAVTRICPLGFYTVTCPIYGNNRLLGFLQVGDMMLEGDEPLQHTRASAISFLPGEEKRIDERLAITPRHTEKKLNALPSLLRAICSHIESKNLFPTGKMTMGMLIKQHIRQHFQGKLTLADIAEHLHCSRSTLTKAFRREFDTTITQYINELRLDRACRLLRNTEQPISVIFEECGFSGAEYFCALFKETFGISPRAYRRKHRERMGANGATV